MIWRVVFEGPGGDLRALTVGNQVDAASVLAEFRARMRAAMAPGACRSFSVGVHPSGPDGHQCDHEVP